MTAYQNQLIDLRGAQGTAPPTFLYSNAVFEAKLAKHNLLAVRSSWVCNSPSGNPGCATVDRQSQLI